MTQTMNAQVSFGSQPQYRPHAASAQIAPQMTAIVYSGKANATTRYAPLSNASAAGRRDASRARPGCLNSTRSWRDFTRYSTVRTAEVISAPSATATRVTWMASQYDCSAGTSGWACEYQTVPARNIMMIAGSSTNPPRRRIVGAFHSTPRNATTPTRPATDANSYMFDHG